MVSLCLTTYNKRYHNVASILLLYKLFTGNVSIKKCLPSVITCSKAPENATVTEGGVARLTVVCSGQYEFDFTLFLDTMDGSAVGEF